MRKHFILTLLLFLLVIVRCSQDPIVGMADEEQNGSLHYKIEIGSIGTLAKRSKITLDTLYTKIFAFGEDSIINTYALTQTPDTSISETINELTARKWKIKAYTKDLQGRHVHMRRDSFTVLPNQQTDVSLKLASYYSSLVVSIFPMKNHIERCILFKEYDTIADTVLPNRDRTGDTLVLSYDYFPTNFLTPLSLKLLGEYDGSQTLLYKGGTQILALSGVDQSFSFPVDYVGPEILDPTGIADIEIQLGGVGVSSVSAHVNEPDHMPPNPVKYLTGIISANQEWSYDTTYVLADNVLIEKQCTVSVEPGTIIRGDLYELDVRGILLAVGTVSSPVTFKSIDIKLNNRILKAYNSDGTYRDGSRFEFFHLDDGSISSDESAFYFYESRLSSITGDDLKGCYFNKSTILNFQFGDLTNSRITNCKIAQLAGGNLYADTIIHCDISKLRARYSTARNRIELNNIGYIYGPFELNKNNITVGNHQSYLIEMKSGYREDYRDVTNNYWGEYTTREMNEKGDNSNITMIYDYYDDYDLSRCDYSNWATEPFQEAGPDW